MKLLTALASGTMMTAAALALSACAAQQVRTPEGALMDTSQDIAYKRGELTQAQLSASNADIFTAGGMNVFRRFPREKTAEMVGFYAEALALRSLNPIQLTATQQMILTGVGSMQIKLSAGQNGDRLYDLEGGYAGGSGIRFFRLTYPDAEMVKARFRQAGLAEPAFTRAADGTLQSLVRDPGGFDILLRIDPAAKDNSDDGLGVGINASNLKESRAFYRDFVGLEELAPIRSETLGTTLYPFRYKETTLLLYHLGDNSHPDNGSAGIQYVVSDAPLAAARGAYRNVPVETPLNVLGGFGLITVWLNDPDGVTNYFAQTGRSPSGD